MPHLIDHSSGKSTSASDTESQKSPDCHDSNGSTQQIESPTLPFPRLGEIPTLHAKTINAANLQAEWDRVMDNGSGTHKRTAVLMISWSKEEDDLETAAEVEELEEVFRNDFHYQVVKLSIKSGKRGPQLQVLRSLLDFVEDYDDGSTLLIVYYAGHGVPGKKAGELHLPGFRRPPHVVSRRNAIVWHEAEGVLKAAAGDILVIFDCCYAGALAQPHNRASASRHFEFLAASDAHSVTPSPGKSSFTSALIWSLRKLAKMDSFTTLQLQTTMSEAPNREQNSLPILFERDEPCVRRLVLAPTPQSVTPADTETRPSKSESFKGYIDMRFFFEQYPGKSDILRLATLLKDFIEGENVWSRRVGWINLHDRERERLLKQTAINTWTKSDLKRNTLQQWRRHSAKSSVQINTQMLHPPYTLDTDISDASTVSELPSDAGDDEEQLVVVHNSALDALNKMKASISVPTVDAHVSTEVVRVLTDSGGAVLQGHQASKPDYILLNFSSNHSNSKLALFFKFIQTFLLPSIFIITFDMLQASEIRAGYRILFLIAISLVFYI